MGVKFIVNCLFIISFCSIGMAQEKYLVFDQDKDSAVKIDNITYYKIDNNLFDTDRFAEVDTIKTEVFYNLELATVKDLWKDADKVRSEIIRNIEYGKPIPVIDTYNLILSHIYILEEISNGHYKKVRVWWVDY